MKADLKVIGPKAIFPRFVTSGGTNIKVGEPLHTVGDTHSSGEASVNTAVLAAADTPVIGTHLFRGIANEDSLNAAAGTTLSQYLNAACPVPYIGRIKGKAFITTEIDTQSELNLIIGDYTLIDYNATGAPDGGELYTIITDATADTSGLEVVGGNPALQTLEVTVAAQAYRSDVS
jgi:hypothetical protein